MTAEPNRIAVRRYKAANLELVRARGRATAFGTRERMKRAVFAAYGGRCACPGCGVDQIEFLSVDHVAGNGAENRAAGLYGSGLSLWQYLKREGFPSGYQLLCHNCNHAKGRHSACPHADTPHNGGWINNNRGV